MPQRWGHACAPDGERDLLPQALVLAALLHLWLVLALGSAPGGTAAPGQGVWGAINVTLRGPVRTDAGEAAPPLPATPTGTPGAAPAPRWGGAVRRERSEPLPEPGAARVGEWTPPAPPTVPPETEPEPAAAVPAPPPSRAVQDERSLPALPAAQTLPAPRPSAPALPVLPLGRVTAPDLPPAAAPLAAVPLPEPRYTAPALPAVPSSSQPDLARAGTLPQVDLAPPLPALGGALPAPAPGAFDAGTRVGHDVATAPSAAASAPPRLNLELSRPRGGELSRHSSAGVLQLLPRPPELPDKLARDIEKTAKPDCRTAYGGAGLLAVVPLAVDALRKDGGCKW